MEVRGASQSRGAVVASEPPARAHICMDTDHRQARREGRREHRTISERSRPAWAASAARRLKRFFTAYPDLCYSCMMMDSFMIGLGMDGWMVVMV